MVDVSLGPTSTGQYILDKTGLLGRLDDGAQLLPAAAVLGRVGSGLEIALKQMNLDAKHVVAVGDAENDLAFLAACGLGVAVANALPSVKEAAGRVMTKPRGEGVVELIDQLLKES